jgi:hypothetical protein
MWFIKTLPYTKPSQKHGEANISCSPPNNKKNALTLLAPKSQRKQNIHLVG